MTQSIELGVYVFPQATSFDRTVAIAKRAEAMGIDSIWAADETAMAFPGVIGFEAFSTLGALARETQRVRLGSTTPRAGG